jgi:hypothetical protein
MSREKNVCFRQLVPDKVSKLFNFKYNIYKEQILTVIALLHTKVRKLWIA